MAFSTGSREAVDALTERLRAVGYLVVSGPRTTGNGYYESLIEDPDGNRVEITIYAPGRGRHPKGRHMATSIPDALIFDMDGTLIDNMAFHTQSWLALFDELGVAMTAGRLEEIMGRHTTATLLRQELSRELTDEEVTSYGERKETLFREIYRPHLRPVHGLEAFLDQAQHRGIPLAVATSAGRRNIDFVLNGLGMMDRFDVIVSSDQVPEGKSGPRIYITTAQQLGVEPKSCLVFEDSRSGISAAYEAGMRIVVVATDASAASFRHLPGVVDVIDDYAALNQETWIWG